tara:strand:+ start:178 stop:411 length:234 start_codon:yes stop_codon:yes gene_type:complete
VVEYNYNKKLGVYIMFNYDKIIKQLELMNAGERLRFCELLCEKNDTLAFSISNFIEVTMMDKVFLENEKKVQKALGQ